MDIRNSNPSPVRKRRIKHILRYIVTAVILFTAFFSLTSSFPGNDGLILTEEQDFYQPEGDWSPVEEQSEEPALLTSVDVVEEQAPAYLYPVGKLSISGRRNDYVSGDMILEIPRLKLECSILDNTDEKTMKKGVCLFEYAQLPGLSNSNTSLVAHRDVYGMEFYNIHKITEGDLMYLTYEGKKYTYEYIETIITHDSDWDPIKAKEFACITLQSCDPIGFSINRIFVTGKMISVEDVEQYEE